MSTSSSTTATRAHGDLSDAVVRVVLAGLRPADGGSVELLGLDRQQDPVAVRDSGVTILLVTHFMDEA